MPPVRLLQAAAKGHDVLRGLRAAAASMDRSASDVAAAVSSGNSPSPPLQALCSALAAAEASLQVRPTRACILTYSSLCTPAQHHDE
jgi:type II secretory pathway component PulM